MNFNYLYFLLLIISGHSFALAPLVFKSQKQTYLNKTFKFKSTHFEVLENSFFNEADNWYNQDPQGQENIQGVAADKAHALYTNKNSIIVAVIDSGVDVNHEDLQGSIWVNKKEIPNNNIDDDGNGYIDDVMGWNFIGAADAMISFIKDESLQNKYRLINRKDGQVEADTLEITREFTRLSKLKKAYNESNRDFPKKWNEQLDQFGKIIKNIRTVEKAEYDYYTEQINIILNNEQVIKETLNVSKITKEFLYNITREDLQEAKESLLEFYETYLNPIESLKSERHYSEIALFFHYNPQYNSRKEIVKDDEDNLNQKYYGNNNVIGPNAFHGTHVAGIIAAKRNNNIGINGVASQVKIMPIRIVPNGDERDKDVANAIYYAVDNGAQIINMSFGKPYSPNKNLVKKAIEYAQKRNVLLIHSAGNDNTNNDKRKMYPSASYQHSNWIEVGASDKYKSNIFANFSNYGKRTVDIFAPGVNIISTIPNNQYASASGTSMAAPVVSGVAAALLSYDNKLKPQEIKDLIITTATRYPFQYVFNSDLDEQVLFSTLSKTAGIPNLAQALQFLTELQDDSFFDRIKLGYYNQR
ncbi:MAG: S8 family serine peptidase [Bacteriovoracaceae bacterium]|jgi:subtilisin family serine protease|nr:S8 family serine peptidase [Bacteriovoracaceae bacterium]